MDLKKACAQLRRLATDGPDDILKYAQAAALLSAFERENHDPLTGELLDSYAAEKISSVDGWFTCLCGIGEDGFTTSQLRTNLQTDIGKPEMIVAENGLSLYTPAMAIADSERRSEEQS